MDLEFNCELVKVENSSQNILLVICQPIVGHLPIDCLPTISQYFLSCFHYQWELASSQWTVSNLSVTYFNNYIKRRKIISAVFLGGECWLDLIEQRKSLVLCTSSCSLHVVWFWEIAMILQCVINSMRTSYFQDVHENMIR